MRINHNMAAVQTYNRAKLNHNAAANSSQKLASGLRINQAADDAAGLGVSEKMRGQIRGLEQAERNIRDGISLLRTAEGALGQIADPNLIRLRELAVQAATGTFSPSDRQAIQKEVDEIVASIDGIANETEFNNEKVLRPPVAETPPTTGGKADIVFIVDVSGSMGGIIDNVISNLDSFTSKLTAKGVDFQLGLVSYSDVTAGEPLTKWPFTSDANAFKTNMTAMRGSMLGGGDWNESGLEGIKDPANGALSLPLRGDASKQFILITDAPIHDDGDGDGGDGLSSYDIDAVASELKAGQIKLTMVGPTSEPGFSQLKRLSDPTGGSYLNISSSFSSGLNTFADSVISDSAGTASDDMPSLDIQIGDNVGDVFSIQLFDARVQKLGIQNLRVDPYDKAVEAIGKIDSVINTVSLVRSRYGAYENALEHIYNNVTNYGSNAAASESQIRDTDMAKEMTRLANRQILLESSQALLTQANQLSQSVLQFLK